MPLTLAARAGRDDLPLLAPRMVVIESPNTTTRFPNAAVVRAMCFTVLRAAEASPATIVSIGIQSLLMATFQSAPASTSASVS